MTRALIRNGFPVGPSPGLNFRAAMMAADRLGAETNIVKVFPDRMERYFSTELFRKLSRTEPLRQERATGHPTQGLAHPVKRWLRFGSAARLCPSFASSLRWNNSSRTSPSRRMYDQSAS